MRLERKASVAILALMLGSSVAIARGPRQGPPQDQDRAGRPDGGGQGGPDGGMRMRMGPDGREGRGEREEHGERRGRAERMGMGMGMGMRGGPGEFRLGRLLNDQEVRQQIGVSAEQAAKIRGQESEFARAEIRNRAEMQIKRIDLRELLTAEKPDRAAIDSKLQELGAAQLAMEKAAIYHHLDMREALTPAQRQKLEQWMRQRHNQGRGDQRGEARTERGPRENMRGNRGAAPPPAPAAPTQPPPR